MTLRVAANPDLGDIGVSPAQAARKIGCHRSRVYKLIRRGALAAYKDGRAVRVRLSSIEAYQEAAPVEPDRTQPAQTASATAPSRRPRADARYLEAVAALRASGVL
jgi:excisionase family DNA binding protein